MCIRDSIDTIVVSTQHDDFVQPADDSDAAQLKAEDVYKRQGVNFQTWITQMTQIGILEIRVICVICV